MSKCPLQIYVNDKYFESCQSVQVGNDALKKTFKGCPKPALSFVKNKQRSVLENDNNDIPKLQKRKSGSILSQYLKEHSESIEAYRNLQKQQEEVLNLCKEKISRQFPPCVKAVLKDEDIIKALRIAENSNYQLLENKSGDQLVRAVLNAIMSNGNQTAVNYEQANKLPLPQATSTKFRAEISASEYFSTKKKNMFNKFVNLFTKSNAQKTYFTASDNYFNNSKFVLNTGAVDLVKYPAISEDYSSGDDKKSAFRRLLNKFGGDASHKNSKVVECLSSSTSDNTSDTNRKKKRNTFLTYYCTYQKDVDFLKAEIKKQKEEIRMIRKNMIQCLEILKAFEERNHRRNFLGNDTQAFHTLTPSQQRGFQNPAEPYSCHYRQYRAEAHRGCDPSCTSKDKTSTNSSTEGTQRKCCCFKKKPKKKKEKKPKTRKKTSFPSCKCDMVCGCPKPSSFHRNASKIEHSDEKALPEVPFTDSFPIPPAPIENCTCKQRRGIGADTTLKFSEDVLKLDAGQVTDTKSDTIRVINSDTVSDELADEDLSATTQSDEVSPSEKRKCCKKKKKRKKKAKKASKRKKKKGKGGEEPDSKSGNGKPVKRSCCIRFLKFICCSSCV